MLCFAGAVLMVVHVILHLNLTSALWAQCSFPHYTSKGGLGQLSGITELTNSILRSQLEGLKIKSAGFCNMWERSL